MVKPKKISAKLVKYLDTSGIKYVALEHRTVYTAIDAANTMKRNINEIAKSLLVKADKEFYLVLLPADNNLDLEKLAKVINKVSEKPVKKIIIPSEKVIEANLKIKPGSITAFGKLHKIGIVLDKKMEKLKKAVFAAGTPNFSIEMSIKDYIKLEEPLVDVIGAKKKINKQKAVKPKRGKKKK